MGHRAHYVVIRDGVQEHVYTTSGAWYIDMQLVGGPDLAIKRIRDEKNERAWLGSRGGIEGGAMIDADHRVVLFSGISGFDKGDLLDLRYRRLVFGMLELMWPGWSVRWACAGMVDIGAYVGIEWDQPGSWHWSEGQWGWADLDFFEYAWTIVTIRHPDGQIAVHPVAFRGRLSPDRVNALPPGRPGFECGYMPRNGIHVDLQARRMAGWHATGCRKDFLDLIECPPDWEIDFWDDNYAMQSEVSEGALSFSPLDYEEPFEWLEQLIRESRLLAGNVDIAQALETVRSEFLK